MRLLHLHAVSAEKLGQHFLADANWRHRIARAVHVDHGLWVEIGAGHGEMTVLLAEKAAKVLAIELDSRLMAPLREVAASCLNVEVIEGDVLAIDLKELTRGESFSVYGNLPYYITSPILRRLFAHSSRIRRIHAVMQMEVAARIVARPGRRAYGYLSVLSQWFSQPEIAFRIPPGAFRPPPKVASALVNFQMPGERAACDMDDEDAFLEFVKECFSQKRKTLKNNLRHRLGDRTDEVLRQAGLSLNSRAEQLSILEFVALFLAQRETNSA